MLLASTACIGAGSDDSGDSEAFATAGAVADEPASEMEFMSEEGDLDMADEEMSLGGAAASAESATVRQTESDSATASGGTPAVPADLGRDIIYTAWISVEAIDVSAAAAEATSIIESVGGFTFAQQTSTRGRAHTTLTFKVRPEKFAAALERLSGVGELMEQNVSAEDVTDIVVDLGSRIGTAEISVDRLREFLSRAEDAERRRRARTRALRPRNQPRTASGPAAIAAGSSRPGHDHVEHRRGCRGSAHVCAGDAGVAERR